MPVLTVPADSRLCYNGFEFGPYTKTDNYQATPVPDPSGRTVKYVRHVFRFRTYLTGSGTSDPLVQAARRALTQPAGQFIYIGRGLDDLAVNTPGPTGVRDVAYGPVPRELGFTHFGGANNVRLDWQIELNLPVGATARYVGPALSLTFTTKFDIDHAGYTTRTLDLSLSIPATRPTVGDRTPPDTVDAYRELLDPPRIAGFRRTWGPWQSDAAKTTGTLQVIDTEMGPNIPPPGVVTASVSHEVSSHIAGPIKWGGVFTGDYELLKTADLSVAAAAFFGVCRDRIEYTRANLQRVPANDAPQAYRSIFPVALTVREPDIYGRRKLSLSLAYTFTCPVKYLLGASGIGRPVPGSNWRLWDYSLRNTAFHPRGSARLEFLAGDDRITDLLDNAPSISRREQFPDPQSLPFGPTAAAAWRPTSATLPFVGSIQQTFPEPRVDESWLYLENELWIESDSGAAPYRLMPLTPLTAATDLFGAANDLAGRAWDALKDGLPPINYPLGPGRPVLPTSDPDVSRRAAPKAVVYLRGRAARVKWGVEPPRLVELNGVKAVPANRLDRGEGFGVMTKTGAAGTRICIGSWNLRYELEAMPTGRLPEPPNPLFGDTP